MSKGGRGQQEGRVGEGIQLSGRSGWEAREAQLGHLTVDATLLHIAEVFLASAFIRSHEHQTLLTFSSCWPVLQPVPPESGGQRWSAS